MSRQIWANWLQYASIELGIAPEQFWQLSLYEWVSLCKSGKATGAVSSGFIGLKELEKLIAEFPDNQENASNRIA